MATIGVAAAPQAPRPKQASIARVQVPRHSKGATTVTFARTPGPTHAPGDPVDLGDPRKRYTCPQCDEDILRLPTGRMRYHGATATRGRRCTFPEQEGVHLRSFEGLAIAAQLWPQFTGVYDAVRQRLDAVAPKKPHGGQVRSKDPTDPNWRWRRK